jgi:hypothetical protein
MESINSPVIRRGVLVALLAVVALAVYSIPTIAADLTITTKTNDLERKMYITPDKMCVADVDGMMIFDAKEQVLRMIDTNAKEVREIRKDDLEAMRAMAGEGMGDPEQMAEATKMMADARAQALESIKDLPEDERKMAEQMINQRLPEPPGAEGSKRTFVPMEKTDKINGFKCKGYTVRKGETVVGEIWTAGLDELGISEKDVAVIGKMREFFASALEGMPFMADAMAEFDVLDPGSESFIGFPVRQIDLEYGEKETTDLVSIDKGVDGKVFETGKDFKKVDFMDP